MVELQIYNGTESLSRLWDNLISTGVVNRRIDSTRFGLLFSAIATEISIALSIAKSYQQQNSLKTATDRNVIENLASMFVVRRLASKAKVVLHFYRIGDYQETVKIPANFAVQSSIDPKIIFYTMTDSYLWKGMEYVSVLAYSVTVGADNNVPANTLVNFASNGYNSNIGVNNPEPAFGGYDDESIESMRQRATGFRYERDGTFEHIRRQLWSLGYVASDWNVTDIKDEPGTYLVCLDVNSDTEFENTTKILSYRHTAGITQVFKQAERIYADFYITVYTTGDADYTPMEKENIFATVQQSVQNFFKNYCTLGIDLNMYHLTSAVNKALNTYNIVKVEIDLGEELTPNDVNVVTVGETARIYPNNITTTLKFQGDIK